MISDINPTGQTGRNVTHGNEHSNLVEAALAFAAQNWPVLPLHTPTFSNCCSCRKQCGRNNGKHPRTEHGLSDATTDPTKIERWWRMWPNANIGIATGATAGLVVLDVDDAAGGWKSLTDLESRHSLLPHVPVVITGGGGAHIYFRHPGGRIRNSAGKLGPGLDLRGDGGYVVAPPSLHRSGNSYGWDITLNPDNLAYPDLPAWLASLVEPRQPKPVANELATAEPIAEGSRNATLTSLAGSMRRASFSAEAMLAALRAENATRCHPPLDDAEVEKIAASIAVYPPGNSFLSTNPYRGGVSGMNPNVVVMPSGAVFRGASRYAR